MENTSCCVCQKPKANLKCGLCEQTVCKYCAQFVEDGQFSFLPSLPPHLKQTTFCGPCYDAKITPEIESYNETMEKAQNLTVFFTTASKQTRNFKRTEKPLKVIDCSDREETLLRLAFLAVKANFNAIIDVDIVSEKVRNGSYQTTKYSGTAMPTQLNTANSNRATKY